MAQKSQKAAAAVESLFRKKPDASTDEFLEVAVAADSSLKGIGKRSFNASYLLPLKRAANPTKKKRRSKKKAASRTSAAPGRRTGKRRSPRSSVSPVARARLRDLVLGRDQQVLQTLTGDGDARAAYELGANLDGYIEELASALRA